jgi:hypothetical protein
MTRPFHFDLNRQRQLRVSYLFIPFVSRKAPQVSPYHSVPVDRPFL